MPLFKYNTEKFTEVSRQLHGDKYDYSKVVYVDYKQKVTIICPEHGEFQQSPNKHFHGQGCIHCGRAKTGKIKRSNLDKFVEKSRVKHGDKYDYSKVVYETTHENVIIICPNHGEFEQTPASHQSGSGCPECYEENGRGASQKYTQEQFIEMSKKVHGEKYDYSKVVYINSQTKVTICCKVHGEFYQKPNSHLMGMGCQLCAAVVNGLKCRLSQEEFLERANKKHNGLYDYSETSYKNWDVPLKIKCRVHGDFFQSVASHLRGSGCPKCCHSWGELKVQKFLQDNNIEFVREKRFSDCKDKRELKFDFWIPLYNLLIEFDGLQHFPDEVKNKKFYKTFIASVENDIIRRDKIKNEYCLKHGIRLLRIKYNDNVHLTLLRYFKEYLKVEVE